MVLRNQRLLFRLVFGGPFLTLHPLKYAKLLKQKMNSHSVLTYLVNTGWVGSNAESGAKGLVCQVQD